MQLCNSDDATINRKYMFSFILCIIFELVVVRAHQKPLKTGLGIQTGGLANLPS